MLPRDYVPIDVSAVVAAEPALTWRAVHDLDLMTVRTPLLTASMWVRGLPARLRGRAEPVPPRLTFTGDGDGLPGWLLLGEAEGEELCFGAVGRFWTPTIEWRPTTLAEFPGFAEPGWGKIACSLSVRPYGDGRSLLTYECRTATYDDRSRRAFARYWRLIRPFVAHIMGATVRTVKANAEAADRVEAGTIP
ncbi:MAG TPA: hypothetical protein VD813_08715 [Pseudonocardia sp.]|nr:hypothetical protein [Pseudonocardia sp.]